MSEATAHHAIVVAWHKRQSRDRGRSVHPTATPPRPLRVLRYVMLSCYVLLLALFAGAQGRAVNISNTWVLPEEGFPVFYRYFRDRISWYEADAVCQFHHANLVTVDTTAQYDAVRAYLKELDISSAVWVGLIRSNPDGDFTWTDYRGLSGDGYWSTAPDERAAPLCAAADPAADYRWEARACGGPTVASFICELPVPQWALGNEGCMVRALPALTALYLPESAAVQLTADCGLAGVKRVQCTGNVKREDLLKDLSCADENETSSSSVTSVGTTWPLTTDSAFADQDTTNDTTTEDITTQRDSDVTQSSLVKATSILSRTEVFDKPLVKLQTTVNQLTKVYSPKIVDMDLIHKNNLQSNDIPKLGNNDNFLTFEESEKLEDEKHMHHKMLHDELARHGNFETIFTQPTDHFVPPLVMAKAKISDDMTVLSLAEKHAQQLAEQRFIKHKMYEEHNDDQQRERKIAPKSTTEEPNKIDILDEPLVMTIQPIKNKSLDKKETSKTSLPKKYKDKYNGPKTKTFKVTDNKVFKIEKSTELSTQTESTTKLVDTTLAPITESTIKMTEVDSPIELSVILKEPDENRKNQTYSNYFGDVAKLDEIKNETEKSEKISNEANPQSTISNSQTGTTTDVTMVHEIIKVTIINEESSSHIPRVFEITTKVPEFKDSVSTDIKSSTTAQQSTQEIVLANDITTNTAVDVASKESTIARTTSAIPDMTTLTVTKTTILPNNEMISKAVSDDNNPPVSTTELPLSTKAEFYTVSTATAQINTTSHVDHNYEAETTMNIAYNATKEKSDYFNSTYIHEEDFEKNSTDISEDIDDFQSPLLSAANEPLHRPNRSRRPQPVNRITKFNPFRMLG